MSLLKLAEMSEGDARTHLEKLVWPDSPVCPRCDGKSICKLKGKTTKPGTYKCRGCKLKFTVTTNTFMHKTHLPIKKWLLAIHLLCSSKKGFSALQLSRELDISYEAAWYMLQRIREGMRTDAPAPLSGTVGADEVYVGGKSRIKKRGRGSERKTPVMVMVERSDKLKRYPHTPKNAHVCTGQAVIKPLPGTSKAVLQSNLLRHVERSATIMTDEWVGYTGVDMFFAGHGVVKHKAREYSTPDGRGNNVAESVNALIRRSQRGVYHWWSKKHMKRYLWELEFRFNNRAMTDDRRRDKLISASKGRKTTYRKLTSG